MQATCQVSSITSDINKKRKQFMFKVTWKVDEEQDDKEDTKEGAAEVDTKAKANKKKDDKGKKDEKGMSGSKVAAVAVGGVVVGALTAGVGLLAGMMVVGMGAAGGGAAVALSSGDSKERTLILATDSYHEAENWVNAIEAQIHDMGDHLFGLPNTSGANCPNRRVRNHSVRPEVRLQDVEDWITTSKWKIYDVYEGVRLLQIARAPADAAVAGSSSSAARTSALSFSSLAGSKCDEPPCMRVNIGINASTADTFSSIINFSNSLQTGIIKSMRIVENIDNFTDVIHLKLEPMFLYPSWTGKQTRNRNSIIHLSVFGVWICFMLTSTNVYATAVASVFCHRYLVVLQPRGTSA